jgi:voltage-gated potassium channel
MGPVPPPQEQVTHVLPPRTADEPLKLRVRRFLHKPWVEALILVLIVASSTLAVVELDVDLTERAKLWVGLTGDLITAVFIVELSLRGWSYHRFSRFLQRYWIDILACVPLSSHFGALRVLRLFRLFRLLRVGTLIRRRYLSGHGGEFALLFVMALVILVFAAGLMAHFERQLDPHFGSVGYSFWWSIFSMVSGEPIGGVPASTAGRGIALLVTLLGLSIFATVTGAAAALMTQRLRRLEVFPMDLEELEGHIVICGWDRRAPLVIEELQHSSDERARPIVVVAELKELPELNWKIVDREKVYLVSGDFTKAENLENAGIRRAAKAIIMSDKTGSRSDQDRDARTILAALTIEKLNREIYTCAELLNREHEPHLRMAGVEDVVCASEYGATLMSSMAIHSGISAIFGELLSVRYGNEFWKMDLPEKWIGKPFGDLVAVIKTKTEAILLAVERPAGGKRREMVLNPERSFAMAKGDRLVLISEKRPDLGGV